MALTPLPRQLRNELEKFAKLSVTQRSAVHFPIVLKFDMLVYPRTRAGHVIKLKPTTTGGASSLKWQCIANYHLY